MPYIRNSVGLAKRIKIDIDNAAGGFDLKNVNLTAGKNVEVEDDCSTTYAEGVKLAEVFKLHLNNAADFVIDVSMKLYEADEKAGVINGSPFDIIF